VQTFYINRFAGRGSFTFEDFVYTSNQRPYVRQLLLHNPSTASPVFSPGLGEGHRWLEDFRPVTLASLIAVSNPMGSPATHPPSTYGGVATLPCAGAVAVGPIHAGVAAGPFAPTSNGALKTQMSSNGYVAVTQRPPSQPAAMPATLLPQVSIRKYQWRF